MSQTLLSPRCLPCPPEHLIPAHSDVATSKWVSHDFPSRLSLGCLVVCSISSLGSRRKLKLNLSRLIFTPQTCRSSSVFCLSEVTAIHPIHELGNGALALHLHPLSGPAALRSLNTCGVCTVLSTPVTPSLVQATLDTPVLGVPFSTPSMGPRGRRV